MRRYFYLITFLLAVVVTSCAGNSGAQDKKIEFENVVAEIQGPYSDKLGASSTVSFDIDWPKSGNEDVVNILRTWILKEILPIVLVYKEDEPIQDLLKSASEAIFDNEENLTRTNITIKGASDSPFEGYVTLHAKISTTVGEVKPTIEDRYSDITVRLSDKKQFNAKSAIADKQSFREMIINNIDWWGNGIAYKSLKKIPYPTYPIALSDSGVEVRYDGSLGKGKSEIKVTVPYSEAITALSEKAKKFLPDNILELAGTKPPKENIEESATKFLYQTYYKKDGLSDKNYVIGRFSIGYSDAVLKKFKELGINSEIDYPKNSSLAENNDSYEPYYSDDLNRLLKKVTAALKKTDNFEYMLMMYGDFEGNDPPFNLIIRNVKVESPEKVVITAQENRDYGERTFVLIKQNGKWYIDDIYSYRAIAKDILGN